MQLKSAAIEAKAHVELIGRHVITPEEVKGQLHLGNIGVSIDFLTDWVLAVPYAVQVVGHDVHKVDVVDGFEVEVAHIPV